MVNWLQPANQLRHSLQGSEPSRKGVLLMFEKDVESLKALGADITTGEIKQQPELWLDTSTSTRTTTRYRRPSADARAMGEGHLSVIFTGAGTSDYVGDTCAPTFVTLAIPTSMISGPSRLLISFRLATSCAPRSHPAGLLRPLRQQPRVSCGRRGCRKFVKDIGSSTSPALPRWLARSVRR